MEEKCGKGAIERGVEKLWAAKYRSITESLGFISLRLKRHPFYHHICYNSIFFCIEIGLCKQMFEGVQDNVLVTYFLCVSLLCKTL